MPKRTRRRSPRPPGVAPVRPSRAARLAAWTLGIAVFLALVAVDVRAQASFDAPKRLVAMLGIAAALALAAAAGEVPIARPSDRRRRWAAGAALAALALAALSAAAGPRPAVAWDGLRTLVVFAAVPLLTAAPRLSEIGWGAVRRGFVAGAAVNAAMSLLQWLGVTTPFRYVTVGGRGLTSAWVGNTGLLGLVLALAAVLLLAGVLRGRSTGRRSAVAGLVALLLAGLAVSKSVTGLVALACGVVVVVLVLVPTRRTRRLLSAGAALAGVALAFALLEARGSRTLNQMLTFRLGPWAAATEMVVERPLLGWGAGGYAAEYVPHVMAAEVRWQTRLANPFLSGSYAEAHNELLQAAAELGSPAAVLLLAVVALGVWPLVRRGAADPERAEVLATLAAGAVASLAWFPLHHPATALLLLAALGRGWRMATLAETEPPVAAPRTPRWGRLALPAAALLLVAPELPRYAAERRLAAVDGALQLVAARTPPGPARAAGLRRIATEAAAIESFPGDERPANTAGMATLLAGDPEAAAEIFHAALTGGERPELVANLGLALAADGRQGNATRAMVRAAWVSPLMMHTLAEQTNLPLQRHVRGLERQLEAGALTLDELPPLPRNPSAARQR